MPELNKANRMVCDVHIRELATKMPFLNFDTANTTTAGLSGDSVYAMAKGTRKIGFPNPIEGTMSIEAQVYPFKLFALFSDGTVESTAVYDVHETIKATEGGKLTFTPPTNGTIEAGTVFVFPKGEYGDESKLIAGTFTENVFTETVEDSGTAVIAADSEYEVGYMVNRTAGVRRVSFNNSKLPKDYYITQKTLDKDEEGRWTPFLMTAYKATIQRNFDLSFNSEGDPATVTLTLTK